MSRPEPTPDSGAKTPCRDYGTESERERTKTARSEGELHTEPAK